MPLGIADYEISNFNNSPDSPTLWRAEVKISHDEMVDDYDVAHWVVVKVRVTASESVTVEELRETVHRKAVDQLRRAIQRVEGKSARELLADAARKVDLDRQPNLEDAPS
ncbi:hypothetical protein GHK03_35690 [Sinorhizobium medicae]|uniref:hypothetical protein n=1 Tax=Sinorhizobium medicae TaxID=110321 RepID=UPI0012965ED1|nr:hypothetical protein [Sinorhizobium medicae]MQY01314.1 hypothetical protein [Sinorhizobium medicae]